MSAPALSFREGGAADVRATFDLCQRALHDAAVRQGLAEPDPEGEAERISAAWDAERGLVEFLVAQPGTRYVLCEDGDDLLGYVRIVRFGEMEELNELMVRQGQRHHGIGHALLERCWPGDPTPDLGRVAVALGTPDNLTLYSQFGVMPATGHWHMAQLAERYLEHRSLEIDATEPGVSMLKPDHAAAEWKRLEPLAIGHERVPLHDFFGRDRICLATMDQNEGRASALCWVGSNGEIGPAVAESPEALVPVIVTALDRVAKVQEPETLRVFCTTISWWLLRRLRGLGFQVFWPGWVMCSVPLPGLDRYVPSMPPRLL